MNGQVAATQTYPAWLKKQEADIQADAFGGGKAGADRADMFRKGKLKLPEFIDQRNRPLSLEKLEELIEKKN